MRSLALVAILTTITVTGAGCPDPVVGFCEVGVRCEGATAERCADGVEARLYGRAAFDGATCVADSAACGRASITCKAFGQCAAPAVLQAASGECVGDDGDFRAANLARCAGHGTCIAADDASCRASSYCALEGRCKAEGGVCVAASDDDCRDSGYCGTLGWCHVTDTREGRRCRATSAADCLPSTACQKTGDCGLSATGQCADCVRSVGCVREGLCDLEGDRCIAISNASCQRSETCRRDGRCRAFQGVCVAGK